MLRIKKLLVCLMVLGLISLPKQAKANDILLDRQEWKHVFYAIDSSKQIDKLPEYDAVSFGWAQIDYQKEKQSFELSLNNLNNSFKVPKGFEVAIDTANSNNLEAYLMVYFGNKDTQAQLLLQDEKIRQDIIMQIVTACKGITKDGQTREFDGVTIDFEDFYSSDLKAPYVQFLNQLKLNLKPYDKKLNVAVQPDIYFKGYDYKGIGEQADKVILMAHDYAPKQLTEFEMASGAIFTPISPINEISNSLQRITDPLIGVQDPNKVVLQISFGSTQWQMKDGKVIHSKPYTPSYDKIEERLKDKNTVIAYSQTYENPYATYEKDGIYNIIWYENKQSVDAKITLAKSFGIYNISYWRLGIIPDFK